MTGARGTDRGVASTSDAEADQRLFRMLRLVVWGHLPLVLLWATVSTIFDPAHGPRRAVQIAVSALICGVVLRLAARGRLRLAGIVLITALWLVIALSILAIGELSSPVWFLFCVVIGEAGLFVGLGAAIATTLVSARFGLVVLALSAAGMIHPGIHSTPLMWWTAGLMIFALVGVIQQASVRLYQAGERRLREELAARVREEAARAEAQRRHQWLFEAAPAGLFELDLHGVWQWLERHGLAGHPDRVRRLVAENPAQAAEAASQMIVLAANDAAIAMFGPPVDGAPPLANAAAFALLLEMLAAGEGRVQREIEVETADGRRRVLASVALPAEPTGLRHVIVGLVDVTEQRQLEEQVRATQRLETVGLLAGGIAHDFNNLLTIVRMNVDRLQRSAGSANRRELHIMSETIDRGAALTRQLLLFSRRQAARRQVVEPHRVLTGIAPLLQHLLGDGVTLDIAADDAGTIEIDPTQLEQVVMNLAVNARDAMPDGGTLRITTRKGGDERVMLEVADTGCGMDEATRARVFEPFFTTKGPGQGSGLGLATVFGIVKQSGGTIAIDTAPGQGTRITIELPSASVTTGDREPAAPMVAPAGTRVLLVEDEGAVRAATRAILEAAGYQVTAVRGDDDLTGQAADLVVSDLPDGGAELLDRLRLARPALPAVLVASTPAGDGVLTRPFTADQLLARVRSALDVAGRQD